MRKGNFVTYSGSLYHHGIKGQKWGKRNGPPYPLDKSGKKNYNNDVERGRAAAESALSKIGGKAVSELGNIKEFKALLKSGAINLNIRPRKQAKHILGSPEWRKELAEALKNENTPPGAFYSSTDIQKLLKTYAGTGIIEFRDEKQKYPVEYVSAKNYIGKVWSISARHYINTKRFSIRYSNRGVHLFPVKDKEALK